MGEERECRESISDRGNSMCKEPETGKVTASNYCKTALSVSQDIDL